MPRRKQTPEQIIRDFKRNAMRDCLCGNDFSRLAAVGDAKLCKYLRRLQEQRGWIDDPNTNIEGPWIRVLCVWFEEGHDGFLNLAKQTGDSAYIGRAISILVENPSPENIALLSRLLPVRFELPTDDNDCESHSAHAIEIVQALSSAHKLQLDHATQGRIRRYAHALLSKGIKKTNMRRKNAPRPRSRPEPGDMFYVAPALGLLRHVGDSTSIPRIEKIPDWSEYGKSEGPQVIAKIKARNNAEDAARTTPAKRRKRAPTKA
jgi:hypothetical protein